MKCFWPTVLDPIHDRRTQSWAACGGVVVDPVDMRAAVVAHFCRDRAGRTKSGGSQRSSRQMADAKLYTAGGDATLDSCLFCAAGWYGEPDRSPAPPRGSVSNLISSKTHLPSSDTIARVTVGKPLQGDSPSMLVPICISISNEIIQMIFWFLKFSDITPIGTQGHIFEDTWDLLLLFEEYSPLAIQTYVFKQREPILFYCKWFCGYNIWKCWCYASIFRNSNN